MFIDVTSNEEQRKCFFNFVAAMAKFTLLLSTLFYLNLMVNGEYLSHVTNGADIELASVEDYFPFLAILDVITGDEDQDKGKDKRTEMAGDKHSEETFQLNHLVSQNSSLFKPYDFHIGFRSKDQHLPLTGFGDLATPPPDFI